MNRIYKRTTTLLVALVTLALVSAISLTPTSRDVAVAAEASAFDPGNLISDENFFNGYAMDAPEVQTFLNARVPVCDPGYTCLKDYVADTPYREAADGRCAAFPGGRYTGAQIIALVGQVCGISQKALLVLLEKESSLVTDTWPMDWQYRAATGQGCPDTAECDSTYRGFFNQVYWAARQFKNYALWPQYYNHHAYEVYPVRFSPNADCGSSDVYLQNQATAGLYNYTPYQPNQAALGNLYGTGDGCSAYGNRNFWRIYSDWFGDPRISSFLVHAPGSSKLYLVTDSAKYLITSPTVANAFVPLGSVTEVSASYLNSLTTGPTLTRIVRGPAGNKWFIDRGQRYAMDCTTVQAYGKKCDGSDIPVLETKQIFAFVKSSLALSPRVKLADGSDFLLSNGQKQEVFDTSSIPDPSVAALSQTELSKNALNEISFAFPLIRSGVIVTNRDNQRTGIYVGTNFYDLTQLQISQSILSSSFTAGTLRIDSFRKLTKAGTLASGFWSSGDGKIWALNALGIAQVPSTAVPASAITQAPAALISSLPQSQTGPLGFAAKTVNGAKTRLIINGKKRQFTSTAQLNRALASGQIGTAIVTVPDGGLAAFTLATAVPDTHAIFTPVTP